MSERTPTLSDTGQRLADVLDAYLAALHAGTPPDKEALLAEHPDLAEDLEACLASLELIRATQVDQATSDPTSKNQGGSQAVSKTLGDYRIIREVGCGGMGVVYEAEQVSLGRRVALKVLPFAAVLDHRQLQRFKSEAQAAARLHHTNIVPVFSVGCERGVHYYAMQYIEGHPLSAIIRELRRLSGLDPAEPPQAASEVSQTAGSLASGHYLPERLRAFSGSSADLGLDSATGPLCVTPTDPSTRNPIYLRSVANLGVQAAEALEHAHQQGIVHRDIKPSNLLLDNRGHLWITDFGLAQCRTDTTRSLTMPGDLLGTVRYMSPEQAMGGSAVLDHRTDIYSLGLTLYELLTLQPAFAGQDRHQLLARIVDDDVRPPRQLNHAIPADLETIVLKAMEKEPGDRYASGQELADDLKRFLEDKPILAKPPTLVDRATKWSRRHRSAVVAAVALLIMLVIGLTISTLLVLREQARTVAEQRRTKDALAQAQLSFQTADEQRQQAEENFQRARDAVDRMLTQAAEKLADVPHMQPARRALLEDALKFYQGFLAERGDDPDVRSEAGRAYRRVGEINELLGEDEPAEESYTQAIAVFEKLVAELPGEPDYQKELAKVCGLLGKFLWRTGRAQDGEAQCRRALTIWEELVGEFPDEPEYRCHVGIMLNDLGVVLSRDTDGRDQAEQSYRRSLAILEKLNADYPDEPEYQSELARIHNNLGNLLGAEQKEKAYREAIALQEKLVAEFPENARYKDSLALYLRNLGNVLGGRAQSEEAEELYLRAMAQQKELTSDFPGVPWYSIGWVDTLQDQAKFLTDNKRLDEAEKVYRQALEVRRQLAAEFPTKPEYRALLAEDHYRLAYVLLGSDQKDKALAEGRQASAVMKQLVDEFPGKPRWRLAMSHYHNFVGDRLLYDFDRLDGAEQEYGQAVRIREVLAAEFPDTAEYRSWLAYQHRWLGPRLRKIGRHEKADRHFLQAIVLREKLCADFPDDPEHRQGLAL